MTKVVYNNCYGGFGISEAAIERYLEIKGITAYPESTKWGKTYWLSAPTGNKKADVHREIFYVYELKRDDPALVQVVEELGEAANDDFAELVIEDIPEGTRYRIEEYDGNEHIEYADSIGWDVA